MEKWFTSSKIYISIACFICFVYFSYSFFQADHFFLSSCCMILKTKYTTFIAYLMKLKTKLFSFFIILYTKNLPVRIQWIKMKDYIYYFLRWFLELNVLWSREKYYIWKIWKKRFSFKNKISSFKFSCIC